MSIFKSLSRLLAPACLLGLFFISGCDESQPEPTPYDGASSANSKANSSGNDKIITHYGRTYPFYGGIMRSIVQLNHAGEIVAVGMMFSERSLYNLPQEHESFVLEFPKHVGATLFTHIYFNWNPKGHFPLDIYGLPHFDLHYYTIPQEERLQIPFIASVPMEDIMAVWPYMPEHYVPTMVSEPMMGVH
jgi:hypothetical protein